MVAGVVDIEGVTSELAGVIVGMGNIALWLQALGVIAVLWIIFETVMLFLSYRRMKEVYKIKSDMKRIEGKIDDLLQKDKSKR